MYKRILVAVDGSPTSSKALATAIGLAQALGGRLRLVHVIEEAAYLSGYDPFGGSSGQLLEAMREAGARVLQEGMAIALAAGVEADNMLYDRLGERLGETVAAAAQLWNADLVVTGTHGRKGVSRLLMGSGAEQIIRLASVPVLVVRSGEDAGASAQ